MNDVSTAYQSGLTLYFIVLDGDGNVWAGSGVGFEPDDTSHWALYTQPMHEGAVPGNYLGTFPTTIGHGIYSLIGYKQVGASPSPSDEQILLGGMDWNGTEEATNGTDCTDQGFSVGTKELDVDIRTNIADVSSGVLFVTGVR